jgi:hypothetical protein
LVPVVGVHAKENPDGKRGRKERTYVPKTLNLDDVSVDMPDGTTRVAHRSAPTTAGPASRN